MFFFTKYYNGYKELVKGIDDSERSLVLKGIGKFLVTFKLIIDLLFVVGLLFVLVVFLVELLY